MPACAAPEEWPLRPTPDPLEGWCDRRNPPANSAIASLHDRCRRRRAGVYSRSESWPISLILERAGCGISGGAGRPSQHRQARAHDQFHPATISPHHGTGRRFIARRHVCAARAHVHSHRDAPPVSEANPFATQMNDAMARMHRDMTMPSSGDSDRGFRRHDDPASPGRGRYGPDRTAVRQGSGAATAGAGHHRRAIAGNRGHATSTEELRCDLFIAARNFPIAPIHHRATAP